MNSKLTHRGRLAALVTAAAVVVSGLMPGFALAPAAGAVTGGTPVQPRVTSMPTADALPTVQIDGVAWSQVVVGNTVYVGGAFATARPAGAALGVNTTARANMLAYDLTTGELIQSFAPAFNGQILAVAASPDHSRIYVGGDFTQANGVNRYRIAALNPTTGAVITSFNAIIDYRIAAIVATNDTVYVGGGLSTANGVARGKLVAFAAKDGSVTSWDPEANDMVKTMVLSPDGRKLIVGGAFTTVSGTSQYGMAAIDAATGAVLPWAPNAAIRDAGANAAITSLTTDGTSIYGSGYVFGSGGNLEGAFSANPDTGAINWIEDCHGDTYSVWPMNNNVYTVSHAHYCGNVGGFPQTDPWTGRHAAAWTKTATGTLGHDPMGGSYKDWYGNPSPSQYNWYPDLTTGTATGQDQAAWNLSGNSQYLTMAGEFPTVNGVAQQGLVRFAVPGVAPSLSKPQVVGAKFTPTITSLSTGTARVAWQSNWDRDDKSLTYKLYRDGEAGTPIYTTTADSSFWNRPYLGYTDTGLVPGSTHTYRLFVFDGDGNKTAGDRVSYTVPMTGSISPYASKLISDGATSYYPLNETAGNTAFDQAGHTDLVTTSTGTAGGTAGPIGGATAVTLDGTSGGIYSTDGTDAPNTFTASVWFNTTTTKGGKLFGFGSKQSGLSTSYDRQVYLDNSGRLYFGVQPSARNVLTTSTSYNDGLWHQVAVTLGSSGMSLYVDGVRVGYRSDTTYGAVYYGFWRLGGDTLSNWSNKPSSSYFAGSLAAFAQFPAVLTGSKIAAEFNAGGGNAAVPPAPTDSYGSAVAGDNPEAYWRLNETTGTTMASAAVYSNDGTYTNTRTVGVPGAVVGTSDPATTFNGLNGFAAAIRSVTAPNTFSLETWFRTNTNRGGQLIGLGNSRTGSSSSYDRQIYMNNSGNLVFWTNPGTQVMLTSAASYNNNQWHHVVATMSSAGMRLYIDGSLIGSNSQTTGQNYTGYWKIAGDSTLGSTSKFFAGTLDEVAVYSSALSDRQVATHYSLGTTGTVPNFAPTAAFAAQTADLTTTVDGSASTDSDGTVASYAWNFGDGATASGAQASHTYSSAGTYPVSLTVTDNGGATNTTTKQVTAVAPNQPPNAAFSIAAKDLTVTVDGSASSDPDGTVASYAWDFGDGATATGVTASHSYAQAGTFAVTVKVTDNRNGTNTLTKQVTVTAPNQPPTAAFSTSAADLTLSADGTGSSDPDGTVASYAWDFGDGASATGQTASHTYAAAGTYSVGLTVTDNSGAYNQTVKQVTVLAPNQLPTAAFTVASSNLKVTVDGTGSSDADGTIASYAWDFGDGAVANGATASHTYAAVGSYTVTLTVTDNRGGAGSTAKTVTVTAPVVNIYAADSFNRTVANGLGSADTGGAWTTSGSASLFSVSGVGKMKMNAAGATVAGYLNAVSARDVDAIVDVAPDSAPTGGGTYLSLAVRHTSAGDYRLKVRIQPTATTLTLTKTVGSTETALKAVTVPGTIYAQGDVLRLRMQVSGSGTTSLVGKVWKVGTAEPATWQLSTSDSEVVLQAAGGVGLVSYLSGSSTVAPATAQWANLKVSDIPVA